MAPEDAEAERSAHGAEDAPRQELPRRERLRGYLALLCAISLAFLLEGVAETGRWEVPILAALFGATLVLSLWVAEARPVVRRVVAVIAVVLFVIALIQAINDSVDEAAARIANGLLAALAPPAIFVGVLRRLRAEQAVTVEAVIGVLCIYILLGMFFSFVFGSIDRISGPFFAQAGATATLSHCLYYSFTTLATVGYGDLTARTNLGHTLSVSEALFGQVYLVTVVSLFVGNLGRRAEPGGRLIRR